MRFLFLDNFRGFSNATVPLHDVSFLVGENSTGKTSFLTILKIFSNPRLFMGPEFFGGEEIELGHFGELVSAHSEDQSYFRIGIIDEHHKDKKGGIAVTGMLFTYKETGGLPQIYRFTSANGDREFSLSFESDNRTLYRKDTVTPASNAKEMSKRIPGWVNNHSNTAKGWYTLDLPPEFSKGRVPLFMVLSMAMAANRANPKEKESFQFFMPPIGPPLVWIAPIRTKVRRTYDEPHTAFSSEGLHTPYVIKRMLSSETEAKKFSQFMAHVGEGSGLFQKIEIKRFGESATSPFEVDAYVDGKALSVGWLGYGVSQSLPIFVELLDRPDGSWFAIQQPEVHLHPRAQACLGDVFFEMAMRDHKHFVIETHSDFTIDRFRLNYRGKHSKREKTKLPKSQILFFERSHKHNIVTSLPIEANGDLPDDQPDSYRRFFIKEDMRLLGLEDVPHN